MNEAINWLYEVRTDYDNVRSVLSCRCPACDYTMDLDRHCYVNYYNYCPRCGRRLFEGDFDRARKTVYGE